MQFPPSPPSPTARSMSVGCVGWWAGGGAGSGVNYLVRNRDRTVETLRDMFRPPFFSKCEKKAKRVITKDQRQKKKKKIQKKKVNTSLTCMYYYPLESYL